jgi:transposase
MQQFCTYGSVRGAVSDGRPYRDKTKLRGWLLSESSLRLYVLFMRGHDYQQSAAFSYLSPEDRVPVDHPLRPIREMVDIALAALSPVFSRIYSTTGRPSIAPEKLLRALLLQVLFTVRSERLLIEQLQYNILYRWFVGMDMDEPVWVPTVFSKNRDRLLEGDIARALFAEVLAQAESEDLLSDERFSVDGTLIEAWASQKSFQRKDGSGAPPGGQRSAQSDSELSWREAQ